MRCYETVRCSLSVAKIRSSHAIRSFKDQRKALKSLRKDEEVKVPKISKDFSAMKWSEASTDFLYRVVGIMMSPLAYVVRYNVVTV